MLEEQIAISNKNLHILITISATIRRAVMSCGICPNEFDMKTLMKLRNSVIAARNSVMRRVKLCLNLFNSLHL